MLSLQFHTLDIITGDTLDIIKNDTRPHKTF